MGRLAEYCDHVGGRSICAVFHWAVSWRLNYALDFPEKVKTLVLIGTPHKIPKAAFGIQNPDFPLSAQICF